MSNIKLAAQIRKHYTATTIVTGHLGWFLKELEERPDDDLVNIVMDYITGEDVGTTSTFDRVVTTIKAVSNLKGIAEADAEALKEAVVMAAPFRAEKAGAVERDAVLLKRADVPTYIASLDTTAQKVIAYLVVTTGAKTSDLVRDENKLQRVKDGVINVGKRTSVQQAASRDIKFDPSYINNVLDPFGEHVQLLSNTYLGDGNVGLVALRDLSSILNGTPLTVSQLRASYALHRVLEDGATWEEVAEEMGVSDFKGLRSRMHRYAVANGLA